MTIASRLDFILYSKGRGRHRDGAMRRNDVIRVTLRKTSYLECHIPQGMIGNSLAVQWLGLCTFAAGSISPIPGWGTKIQLDSPEGKKRWLLG